ncbi:MAG: murein L,D-transpeptidase catalytic domain-containing protein, partial [Flavobacteriaceae bacterium]
MYFKNFIFLIWLFLGCSDNKNNTVAVQETFHKKDYTLLHSEALEYCKTHHFSQDYYILIDMSIHSGKNRFFIYDFASEKITHKKPVTHGSCDVFEENPEKWHKAKFSNKDG